MTKLIGPGSTIGILGAGQLGRMLAISARQMGYRIAVYGGDRTSPAGQVSDHVWSGSFTDEQQLSEFAAACDVVTYEFENVPATTARVIGSKTALCPGEELLSTAQNRFAEKSAMQKLGLATAGFRMVSSEQELMAARADFGGSVILKANTDGYDGKGQWAVGPSDNTAAIWQQAGLRHAIVEERISFDFELSIIAGRYPNGACVFYDPMLNHHASHILDVSISNAPEVTVGLAETAREMARTILDHFRVVGVLCVELFLTTDGRLLVNEIAPRPHNSGHLTIEAYNCSQFELQLRTICGLPEVPLIRRSPAAAMANLLGQHLPETWTHEALTALHAPEVHLHQYGKSTAQHNRKMGHITVLSDSAQSAEHLARQSRAGLLQ